MKDTIVLVTGGFDPIHSGHIDYFNEASKFGNRLVVGLNSDEWLIDKKSIFFMPWSERAAIIRNISSVDEVISFDDSDGSACAAIRKLLSNRTQNIIFANGGDRTNINTPELIELRNNKRVKFLYGVGGETKKNSSSNLLDSFINKTIYKDQSKITNNNINKSYASKPWGRYKTILTAEKFKLKIIDVEINMQLSLQYHRRREEHWIIVAGKAEVHIDESITRKEVGDYLYIPRGHKHRIKNIGNSVLTFIEVALGDYIQEDDIVRIKDDFGRVE